MSSENKYFYGVGRRKTSAARAKYYPGVQPVQITVNKRPIKDYFQDFYFQTINIAVSNMGITTGEIALFVKGGGTMGQSEACRLAITKSLVKMEVGFKPMARLYGYMSTDIRQVLPKKAGFRKARKREQWSKR
jgi:small subunit ribosomal protein S9